ncbi:MAG: response regulator [Lacisediminihabitans sp.]
MTRPKLRTVIVDDDIDVARIHWQFVASHTGFTVVGEAHSGSEALSLIEQVSPDVVLLDFYLPDFSGLELLSRVRVEHGRHLEVIAVTAARDLASVREARANGVRHYLVKPFTASALFERLDEVAREYATMHRTQHDQPLDQRTVDEIIASSAGRYIPPPKGLADATLQRVIVMLQSAGNDVSAAEAAELTGISRVSARRYLEHLVSQGRATLEPRYGGAGRPENRYRSSS